jgi:hypothetical protein
MIGPMVSPPFPASSPPRRQAIEESHEVRQNRTKVDLGGEMTQIVMRTSIPQFTNDLCAFEDVKWDRQVFGNVVDQGLR